MSSLLHTLYKSAGYMFCRICLVYWNLRDLFNKPSEKSILFVTHPDDDTLFFHTFIKENKPYVVLMTTGWSLKRIPDFFKAMKQYGVRYRAYPLESREKRKELLERIAKRMLSMNSYEFCATHNFQGEYGHDAHRMVHEAVVRVSNIPVYVPAPHDEMVNFPLSQNVIDEKKAIFQTIYTTEKWVVDEYSFWLTHEKLIQNS